ncbi:DNase I-like protein, partial [Trametes sanguinea]
MADKRGSRGRIRLGSLNMKGFGIPRAREGSDKWLAINQLMKDARLSVLGIQEAHLNHSRVESLNNLFGTRLKIVASMHPSNPTGAGGVAFVTNLNLHGSEDAVYTEIVPGRALMLTLPWGRDKHIRVLNVYAPNVLSDNAALWDSLKERYTNDPAFRPDIVLGDFNMVEESIDRCPARTDPGQVTRAFADMKERMGMCDTWRRAHPGKREFTYMQAGNGAQSRLDRIYASRGLVPAVADWKCAMSAIPTDHALVSLSVARYNEPNIGKGRWTLPLHLLDDAHFIESMKTLGFKLQDDLNGIASRSVDVNPQKLWAAFKSDIRNEARARMKLKVSKIEVKIKKANEDIAKCANEVNVNAGDEDRAMTAALLRERVTILERKKARVRKGASAAKDWAHGEKIGKYWIRMNAPK